MSADIFQNFRVWFSLLYYSALESLLPVLIADRMFPILTNSKYVVLERGKMKLHCPFLLFRSIEQHMTSLHVYKGCDVCFEVDLSDRRANLARPHHTKFCRDSTSSTTNRCWSLGLDFLTNSELHKQSRCLTCRRHQVLNAVEGGLC